MNREDLTEKTFSLEDQIRYFKSHENELERRILLLLESDSFFFTTLSEVDMKARDIQKSGPPCSLTRARSRSRISLLKALSWDEIEKDQNISFISFNKYLENILDEINS